MATVKLRRGPGEANRLFRLWMRLPGRDGTEDGRALNAIVYPGDLGKWASIPRCSR